MARVFICPWAPTRIYLLEFLKNCDWMVKVKKWKINKYLLELFQNGKGTMVFFHDPGASNYTGNGLKKAAFET
jgi:hypothetical protein